MKGFSFIEALVVISITSFLVVLIVPLGINFYKGQQIEDTANGLVQVLRRAQLQAMSQADYSFGVHIIPGEYILFRGDSYILSGNQESFEAPRDVVFSGVSEVVFSKLYGVPSQAGDINLSNGLYEATVSVNELGRVSYLKGQLTPDLPALYFSSSEYSTEEGIESITIEVNLDRQSQDIVQVNYSTRDGTAVHPQDYIETKGVLVFDPGDTQETFEVPIVQDSNSEPDEIFQVYLENPVNAILGTPNVSTVTILDDDGSLNCWGIGGSCDPDCQYSDFGVLTSYYRDPGCSERCQSVGNIYTNYTFSCSTDGTGNCYRMNSSQREPTSCTQSNSCEGICEGECVPCREIINEEQCTQQQGCFWFFSRCFGRCTPCQDLQEEQACKNQLKCEWKSTKWFWILGDYQSGYSSYTTCQWYE